MLKMTDVEFELLTDSGMALFIEKSLSRVAFPSVQIGMLKQTINIRVAILIPNYRHYF